MMQYIEFIPNWTSVWTASEAEHALPDFKFNGPGWYFSDKETTLVVARRPVLTEVKRIEKHQPPSAWADKWPPGTKFDFHIFLNRNPFDMFKAIFDAPVRQDDRSKVLKPRTCLTCKHYREDPDGEYCASNRSFVASHGTLMSLDAALDEKNNVCGPDRTSWEGNNR